MRPRRRSSLVAPVADGVGGPGRGAGPAALLARPSALCGLASLGPSAGAFRLVLLAAVPSSVVGGAVLGGAWELFPPAPWDWGLGSAGRSERVYLGLALLYVAGRIAAGKRGLTEILLPKSLSRLFRSRLWKRNTTNMYKTLPLRMASRCWGWVNTVELYRPLRKPILGLYVWAFDCDMAEAEIEDLSEYANLSELFNRKLKPGLRPIASDCILVSPADGFVQGYGLIENGMVEQVKGINYPLKDFLGHKVTHLIKKHEPDDEELALHYCTLYLAPGDYHAFHSPADWSPEHRIHFSGELLSVSGWIMERVGDIMTLNERVLLSGRWAWGFFSYTAVGATNVGNIVVDGDAELRTNVKGKPMARVQERRLAFAAAKGDRLGEFRLGSSVVLVFQAPKTFRFIPLPGSKIRYGEPLGRLSGPPS